MQSLKDLEAGDYVEGGVDKIVEDLREENPDKSIDYENVYSDASWYLAEVAVDGRTVAVVESQIGTPMVKEIMSSNIREIEEGEIKSFEGVDGMSLGEMMEEEDVDSLEVDKKGGSLTIKQGGEEICVTLDLIHEFEDKAKKDSSESFTVTSDE